MFDFIGYLIIGLIIGALAKLIMPGKDPGGCIVTTLIGILGSLLAGFVVRTITGGTSQAPGFIASVLGAIFLLFLYRLFVGRKG